MVGAEAAGGAVAAVGIADGAAAGGGTADGGADADVTIVAVRPLFWFSRI